MYLRLREITQQFHVRSGTKVAVDHVSLEFQQGERVGIIGPNGAGKTTLLQIAAGLAVPTSGTVEADGRVTCIMTLGVGLREDATGRENIYLDGELNGRIRQEVDEQIEALIAFAELGKFIEYPVRTYSTGMKARLAFAMLMFIEPEILIIDEALSAGDTQFAQKASAKMREICDRGRILILVSHSLEAICSMTNRCVWMDQGRVMRDGPSAEVTEAYRIAVRQKDEREMCELFRRRIGARSRKAGFAITGIEFKGPTRMARRIFASDEPVIAEVSVQTDQPLKSADLRLGFLRMDGHLLFQNSACADGVDLGEMSGSCKVVVNFGPLGFGESTYEVLVELLDVSESDRPVILATLNDVIKVEKPAHVRDNPALFTPVEWACDYLGQTT